MESTRRYTFTTHFKLIFSSSSSDTIIPECWLFHQSPHFQHEWMTFVVENVLLFSHFTIGPLSSSIFFQQYAFGHHIPTKILLNLCPLSPLKARHLPILTVKFGLHHTTRKRRVILDECFKKISKKWYLAACIDKASLSVWVLKIKFNKDIIPWKAKSRTVVAMTLWKVYGSINAISSDCQYTGKHKVGWLWPHP